MGDTQNTANTTNHHTMKRAIVIAASLALVWGAPQFKTDTIRSNCRSEVTTVFEETETETVNKVICQTEFREDCSAKVSMSVTTEVRRMDGSKIIFSDHELDARNKDLASRVYLNVVPTRPTSTESAPRTSEDPHSRIFFPE